LILINIIYRNNWSLKSTIFESFKKRINDKRPKLFERKKKLCFNIQITNDLSLDLVSYVWTRLDYFHFNDVVSANEKGGEKLNRCCVRERCCTSACRFEYITHELHISMIWFWRKAVSRISILFLRKTSSITSRVSGRRILGQAYFTSFEIFCARFSIYDVVRIRKYLRSNINFDRRQNIRV